MSDGKIQQQLASRSSAEDIAGTVSRISRGSNLYDIRTIGTYARLHDEAPVTGTPLTAGLTINVNCQNLEAEQEFRLIGKFSLKAHEEHKPEGERFFSAVLHIVAYYRLLTRISLGTEELKAFATSNGMIHLWPYVRSFVQQACGQFSIPPIVLPPFRVGGPLNLKIQTGQSDTSEPQ